MQTTSRVKSSPLTLSEKSGGRKPDVIHDLVQTILPQSLLTPDEPRSPVVLPVVSTKGGEGKSTKAGNIAGYTADAGLKTLLIDGDYNQPTASSIFKLSYEAPCGLYELLMQTSDLSIPDS
ncbi:ParA family protein, partial [Salmonella enterica]|nr:ParA family protein [Salmonella enterica]